jgi:transposase
VDRGRTASKRHLICDGSGLPLAPPLLSAANVNDYGMILPLLDRVAADRPAGGRLVLADRGYDSHAVREGISERGHEPRIPKRNPPGAGKRRDSLARERSVIERTFAWLSWMRRLATRWERRDDLHLAFLTIGCALICWRRLQHTL